MQIYNEVCSHSLNCIHKICIIATNKFCGNNIHYEDRMNCGIRKWPFYIIEKYNVGGLKMYAVTKIISLTQLFHCFWLCFTYILPQTMVILYFRLPYFHVSNSALFFTSYFSTLILHRQSLDTFYTQNIQDGKCYKGHPMQSFHWGSLILCYSDGWWDIRFWPMRRSTSF